MDAQGMKRGRGRPPTLPKPKSCFVSPHGADLMRLSDNIGRRLSSRFPVSPSQAFTMALGIAALSYLTFREVRHRAPLVVKRRGNRPHIHLALLLADCAKAYAAEYGKDAQGELRLMRNGHTEGWSRVAVCVEAVLEAVGEKHPQSLRQQARRAAAYL